MTELEDLRASCERRQPTTPLVAVRRSFHNQIVAPGDFQAYLQS